LPGNVFHFPQRLVILNKLRVPSHEAWMCHLMDDFREAPERIEYLGPGQ
jgi:hypothetical protein